MKIGKFEIYNVLQDWFALDGGVLFGGIPREHWRTHTRPGRGNAVRLPINCFLILAPSGKRILVDASLGDVSRFSARAVEQFHMRNGSPLSNALRRFDLAPEDIDMVLYTHLHFDHAGGAVRVEDGKLVPSLPRARSFAHRGEIEHILSGPHPKTQSSYRRETMQGVEYLHDKKMFEVIFEEEIEVEPGLTMVRTKGHTEYHMSVKIESEGEVGFIAGALITTRWHVHPAYSIGNDTHPYDGANAKLVVLSRAVKENWMIFLEHDTQYAGRLAYDEEKKPVFVRAFTKEKKNA